MFVWRRKNSSKPSHNTHRSNSKTSWEMVKDLVSDGDKWEQLADRAESLLLCLKQRFPGLPQTTLDMSKIQYNKVFTHTSPSSFALFVSMLTHATRLIRMSGNLSWRATQESLRAWHSTLWRVLMTYCMWMTCRSIQIIACHSPRLERLLVKALHLRSTSQLVHTRRLCPLLASRLCSSRALQGEIDHHTLRAASITFMDSV